MQWYLFLDDERFPTTDILNFKTIIVRDYTSAIQTLQFLKGQKIIIDFDHDLGVGRNGYDVSRWIVENQYPILGFHIHSMNTVGADNIRQLLTHYGYKEY